MQKKTLIFDLGNVIINLKSDEVWHNEDLYPNFDTKKLQHLHQSDFFNEYETGKISTDEFIHQLKIISNNPTINNDLIFQNWNAILLDIPTHRIELLYQLKQNYNLYLLSNTKEIHLNYILQYLKNNFGKNVFDELFAFQFYSQKMGLRKPNAAIFEEVLNQLNRDPTLMYFFDDKSENLIEPNKLGIQTVLVDKDIVELTNFLN